MSNSTSSPSDTTSVIDTTETSTVTSNSESVVTQTSTITSGSSSSISTSKSTSTSSITTISVITTSSTTTITPTSTSTPPASTLVVTSLTTVTPTDAGSPNAPTVVTITSTRPEPTPAQQSTTAESSTSTSASPSALGLAGQSSGSSGKLSSGGTIAIAVVIPIVVIALLLVFGLWCFKRRQKKNNDRAMRQKEMADYGYNPNNDPTLVPAMGVYSDNASDTVDESGYRGWGTTSTAQRKPSTNLGSGNRGPLGMAVSDSSSNPAAHGHPGFSSGHPSEPLSGETLHSPISPLDGAVAGGLAGGAAGAAGERRKSNSNIQRGTSNASSAYSSGHAISELSDEPAGGVPGPYHHDEVPYNIYSEAQPRHGPFGDGSYGVGRGGAGNQQPVIQNVGARRDPRIERVPTLPQQGGPTIAQNF